MQSHSRYASDQIQIRIGNKTSIFSIYSYIFYISITRIPFFYSTLIKQCNVNFLYIFNYIIFYFTVIRIFNEVINHTLKSDMTIIYKN